MHIYKKLETETINNKKIRFGLFQCPFCYKIIKRRWQDGLNLKSCGCSSSFLKGQGSLKNEYSKTHGKTKTAEHIAWVNLKDRCYNSNHKYFYRYGGRGIKVCDRWLNSFENFYEDMGEKPNSYHTIERIDNNGNYEPNNCKWSSIAENSRNRSTTKLNWESVNKIRSDYKKGLTLEELSKKYNIKYKHAHKIINNHIWGD